MNQIISLGFFLLLVLAASALGGTFEAGYWYQDLNRPPWTPADWLLSVVWAVVYVTMALAAWRVWISGRSLRLGAIVWWLLVLVLNTLWPWLIFGLHRPGWAFFLGAGVVAISIMCCRAFFLLSRPAGAMMIPFVLWAAFITYLNFAFWNMNGGGFGTLFG